MGGPGDRGAAAPHVAAGQVQQSRSRRRLHARHRARRPEPPAGRHGLRRGVLRPAVLHQGPANPARPRGQLGDRPGLPGRRVHRRRGRRAEGQGVGNETQIDPDLPEIEGRGWYVAGTWVITGENRDGGVKPKRPLLQGGFGAVEVAARYEKLSFASAGSPAEPPSRSPRAANIAGNADSAWTIGVNWYVNRWAKLRFNVINETLDDPGSGARAGRLLAPDDGDDVPDRFLGRCSMAARRLLAGALLLAASVRGRAGGRRADLRGPVQRPGPAADRSLREHEGLVLAARPPRIERLLPGEHEVERHHASPTSASASGAPDPAPTTKPALRVDFDRYAAGRTFLGLSPWLAQQQRPGPVGRPGVADDEDVPRDGPAGAAHGAGRALHQQRVFRPLHADGGSRRGVSRERVRREQPDTCSSTGGRPIYYFGYLGSALAPYAALYEPKTRVTESMGVAVPAGRGDDPRHQRRVRRELRGRPCRIHGSARTSCGWWRCRPPSRRPTACSATGA